MTMIEKIICVIPIDYTNKWAVAAHLGLNKGELGIYFMDPSNLEMDEAYVNEKSYPNCGLMNLGRNALWMSMFERHISKEMEEIEETNR